MPSDASTGALALTAIPENLLREPLEYLLADHFRLQEVCRLLVAIAAAPDHGTMRDEARAALDYLTDELPLHIADEEEDLFRRLRDRCEPGDSVDLIIDALSAEHARDSMLTTTLIADLRPLAGGKAPADMAAFCLAARTLCETKRRHLAWEAGVLLPIARCRLTVADWRDLGRRMAARRGIDYPD